VLVGTSSRSPAPLSPRSSVDISTPPCCAAPVSSGDAPAIGKPVAKRPSSCNSANLQRERRRRRTAVSTWPCGLDAEAAGGNATPRSATRIRCCADNHCKTRRCLDFAPPTFCARCCFSVLARWPTVGNVGSSPVLADPVGDDIRSKTDGIASASLVPARPHAALL
jgi:hypothetical protein